MGSGVMCEGSSYKELIEDLLALKDIGLLEKSCPLEKEKDFA